MSPLRPANSLDLTPRLERSGLPAGLRDRVALLTQLYGQSVQREVPPNVDALLGDLRATLDATDRSDADRLAALASRLATAPLSELTAVLKIYTGFFRLLNKTEQLEIVRINRERARVATVENPRADSIAQAVHALHAAGCTLEQALAQVARLDLQPTLTAHPTEARRRTVTHKLQRIGALVDVCFAAGATPEERDDARRELAQQVALLLVTNDVRDEGLTVAREVQYGLVFLGTSIWEAVPSLYHDFRRAFVTYYGVEPELPVFLRYRSWIGGDRDGNPKVTVEVTRAALAAQRRAAQELYLGELNLLREELSLSGRYVKVDPALLVSLAADAQDFGGHPAIGPAHGVEPFREKLDFMIARWRRVTATPPVPYPIADFIADLKLLRLALRHSLQSADARVDRLEDLWVRARTFGSHLAALDFRQHSRVHAEVVGELLVLGRVTVEYATMSEPQRVALLNAELVNPRPLVPRGGVLSPQASALLNTFALMAETVAAEPTAVGAYIISMTHSVSDVLEVLLLAKESGLWRDVPGGTAHAPIDVVPLFETIDDLAHGHELLRALFANPIYRAHLKGRGDFQEIMLGYSDSNKDGGFWMANWALYEAQGRLAEECTAHGLDFRLFHGRGGSVGRGGGRANQAILAMPDAALNGRMRVTEQGEVISFRYALPALARRHLEQIVNAMLLGAVRRSGHVASHGPPPPPPAVVQRRRELMARLAQGAMATYRQLLEDPEFWAWYTTITPIEHISRLPIASRPVSRASGRLADFEDLRAIPWVFAWTQTRFNVPGWYGLGAALANACSDPVALEELRACYREWPFFSTVLGNAEMELARTRLPIAGTYAAAHPAGSHLAARLATDARLAEVALRQITGENLLLGGQPVLQRLLTFRMPFCDVLNLTQVELLKRWRAPHTGTESEREDLRRTLFLSINGVAAAMQSTG